MFIQGTHLVAFHIGFTLLSCRATEYWDWKSKKLGKMFISDSKININFLMFKLINLLLLQVCQHLWESVGQFSLSITNILSNCHSPNWKWIALTMHLWARLSECAESTLYLCGIIANFAKTWEDRDKLLILIQVFLISNFSYKWPLKV